MCFFNKSLLIFAFFIVGSLSKVSATPVVLTPATGCGSVANAQCYSYLIKDTFFKPTYDDDNCGKGQECRITVDLAMVTHPDWLATLSNGKDCPPTQGYGTLDVIRPCQSGSLTSSITLSKTSGLINIPNTWFTTFPYVCVLVKYATWGSSGSNAFQKGYCQNATSAPIPPPKACNISGTGAQAVPLDSIISNQVAQAGKTDAGSKTFNLVFDCPANAKVSVTPSGTALVAAQGVYKNLSTGTTAATNIGVAMECDNGSGTYAPLVPNTILSLGTTAVEGLTTRTCKASYYSQGNATAGAVSAQSTLTFTYN